MMKFVLGWCLDWKALRGLWWAVGETWWWALYGASLLPRVGEKGEVVRHELALLHRGPNCVREGISATVRIRLLTFAQSQLPSRLHLEC